MVELQRMKMMGFASDWMRPTLRRLLVLETPFYEGGEVVWAGVDGGSESDVRLDSRDDQPTHRSVERLDGELRHIKQRYLEGDDNWQVAGKSWHWQPVTPDVAYEYKDAGK